jgi:hypothetical protein
MITITCPWCEGDAPFDPDLLLILGGHWECGACRTSVSLVETPEEALPIAA